MTLWLKTLYILAHSSVPRTVFTFPNELGLRTGAWPFINLYSINMYRQNVDVYVVLETTCANIVGNSNT